ncbi:hypothetical protein Tco_1107194 [Tanacetum coccineum]
MVVQHQEEMGEGSANPTNPHHTPTIIQPSTSQSQKKQKSRKPMRKDTEVPQPSGPTDNVTDEAVYEEMDDNLERVATTATSLDAKQDRGNINKTQSKATLNEPSSLGTSSGSGPRDQETMGDTIAQTGFENVSKTFNDSLLVGVNTPRSDEDSLKLKELMELCTNFQNRVIDLEKTKTSLAQGIINEGLGEEDASKQGRIDDIDADEDIYIVNGSHNEDIASKDVNLSVDEVTLAQALAALKSAKPKADKVMLHEPEQGIITTTTATTTVTAASTRPKAKGLVIHEEEQATTPTISSQQPPKAKVQDKGKGIMVEEPLKMKKKDQVSFDEQEAIRLQAEFDEEERLAREKDEANVALTQEQEELTDAEKARLFVQFLEQRRKHFASKRAEEKRNRPPTRAQQRSIMVNTFVDYKTELVEKSSKKAEAKIAQESSSERICIILLHSILYYLLVEKKYPLTNHTLHQMFNDVKLQVDYECEMAFELLRLLSMKKLEILKKNVKFKGGLLRLKAFLKLLLLRFEALMVLDYLSRTVASYIDVAEVILKDIDNDDDYREVGSMMDLVLGREAYVFILINEMGEHWCLAQYHILSGEVTFYDIRISYSEMLDMIVYKLECEIRGLFYCIPRNSLEIGLTIIEGDPDIKKIYDMAEMYGLINLYNAHVPKNLATYYFRNLSFDDYHRDIQPKLKSHEKLKMDAASMTFDELVAWEKEESLSPLLRTPPLKPRRIGIEFPVKNLYAEFFHADYVDDHFDPLDYWKYEDMYGGGCFDVSGDFKGFDWIDEPVGSDDYSFPGKSKDEFSNEVILDDVVFSPATTLSLLLKRKGKSRVKFTRMGAIIKRSKMLSLRKSLRSNYGRFITVIGLNKDMGDDDLKDTGCSFNNDLKDHC